MPWHPLPRQPSTAAYREARDTLVALSGQHDRAVAEFRWPDVGERFNWAIDWFDAIARDNAATALWIVEEDGSEAKLTLRRAGRRAPTRWPSGCAGRGVGKGDRVLLMLGNQVELWEAMLAVIKLGAVVMPTTAALGPADLRDRVDRGGGAGRRRQRRRRRRSSTRCPATTCG